MMWMGKNNNTEFTWQKT